jgi:hypothetical protein
LVKLLSFCIVCSRMLLLLWVVDDGESSNWDGCFEGKRSGGAKWRSAVKHNAVLELALDCAESIAEHQDRHFHIQAQLAVAIWACNDHSVLRYKLACKCVVHGKLISMRFVVGFFHFK